MEIEWHGKAVKTKTVKRQIPRKGDLLHVHGEIVEVTDIDDWKLIVEKRDGTIVPIEKTNRAEINRRTR